MGELWGYFTQYAYMPRLVSRDVLDRTIAQALSSVLVEEERFAVATGKDPETGRYWGLVIPPNADATIQITDSTLLVDVERAQAQIEADRSATGAQQAASVETAGKTPLGREGARTGSAGSARPRDGGVPAAGRPGAASAVETILARFFGTVKIDPDRYARDIGNVTREVIDRLAGAGARLEITIDIQATKPEGFNESEIRTIKENARVLKFDPSSDFEER